MIRISHEQILSRLDIDSYYRDHLTGPIKSGQGGWCNCRCPLPGHDDRQPSFGFNRNTGAFKCFGCGRSGQYFQIRTAYARR